MVSNNGIEDNTEEVLEEMLQVDLTEEAYEELAASEGATVAGMAFWSASLADELEEETPEPEDRQVIDLDIYLSDRTLLELYAVSVFRTEDADPVTGMEQIEAALIDLADNEAALEEVAETDGGDLALVWSVEGDVRLIMVVGAWAVGEYDDLPEDDE